MLYKRGEVWWYKFRFSGQDFRESTKTGSKSVARKAEVKRKRDLETGLHGLRKRVGPVTFSVAAKAWLQEKRPSFAPKSTLAVQLQIDHLKKWFGSMLLSDIAAGDIADYQTHRREKGAAPKSVNLEVATLRSVLRRNRFWAEIQPDVKMLPVTDTVGMALTAAEERRVLDACLNSRSGAIFPVVTLALSTGMRYDEIRTLRWQQIDFLRETVTVGKSKTEAGTGRVIPLNARAAAALRSWAALAPGREPEHYAFPRSLETPLTPTTRWEKAWQNVLDRAGVRCRFHDLRHTACTRMLEAGVPLSVVANLFGWSAATTTRMAKRYGHITDGAQRQAVCALDGPILVTGWAQNAAQLATADEPLKKVV